MAFKILIIEDEVMMAELLKKRLQSHGYDVLIEHDGQKGLETSRSARPDIILLDLMLPSLDGYKICRLLKFDDKYKHIPIVMLTALGQESDASLGKDVGADAYFLKPYDSQQLLAKIEELLKKPQDRK